MNPQINKLLSSAKTVAIIGHINPDGDCFGSISAINDYISTKHDCVIHCFAQCETIAEEFKKNGAKVSGPVPLPTKKEVVTILRAVHKYKDSREQFEQRTHKRLIDVTNATNKTVEALQKLDAPAGVDIYVKL